MLPTAHQHDYHPAGPEELPAGAVWGARAGQNKRPADKAFVTANVNYGKAKVAAGDPPDGVNGPTCFNYHFGGNCRWGHLCNRAADHKTTDKADVAARAQHHASIHQPSLFVTSHENMSK